MNTNEVIELRKECINTVKAEIRKLDFEDLIYEFADLANEIKSLPTDNESVIKTYKGIIGYKKWLEQNGKEREHFLDIAFLDLIECLNNYKEPWYSPQTQRFVEFHK